LIVQYTKDTASHAPLVVYRPEPWADLDQTAIVFNPNAPAGERISLLIKPGHIDESESAIETWLDEH
jgi:hypothetical protein